MEGEEDNLAVETDAGASLPTGSPLDFIRGELQPPKSSLVYRLGLMVVAFTMVLLPLLYFGLVGLFAYGVYYYAAHYYTMLSWGGSSRSYGYRGGLLLLIAYLGPIFIGAALTFFLIKPLFNRRSDNEEHYSLNHADAPQLFTLIGWICRSLNAPIPSRIDVNCDVNASAGFRGGWRSLFGNDVVLTIGLPLVAGLNLNQFAGVIAHEYGHFSQGTAMRASYVIRRINLWFARVVYERDSWDVSLVAASEDSDVDWRFMILLYLTRLGVWFGRSILWVFMVTGHLISSFMARQMEFDADLYEIRMSGTDAFVATLLRLKQLDLGSAIAQDQLVAKWKKERKLFDQLPEFIASRANDIPAEQQEQLFNKVMLQKTRLFDSHPADADRVKRALQANEPGIFHSEAPAVSLFTNFAELSRTLTLAHYAELTGEPFAEKFLAATESIARESEHDYAADQQIIKGYFHGVATSLHPILLPEPKGLVFRKDTDLIAEIKQMRQQMQELLPVAEEAYSALKLADEQVLGARQAHVLLKAGYQYSPADFGIANVSLDVAESQAHNAFAQAAAALQPFSEAGKTRLGDALNLLRLPHGKTHVPSAVELQEEAKQISWTLARVGGIWDLLFETRKDCAALEILLHYRQQGSADNLQNTIENLCTGIQERVNQIQLKMSLVRYPYQHTTADVFVSEYARNKEYHPDPFQLVLKEGQSHIEKLIALYCRLLSNLITISEAVEKHAVDQTG
ncbi:MAG: Peptidase Ste24p [Pedosphaera sp.]|nr:Peptidase Ste24p [Pedosphaera sp.]